MSRARRNPLRFLKPRCTECLAAERGTHTEGCPHARTTGYAALPTCPVCAAEVVAPRAAWFGPGSQPVTCPNGHTLSLRTTVRA